MCLFQQNFTKKHCEIEGILGVQILICQNTDQSLPKLKIKVQFKAVLSIPIVSKIRYFFQLYPCK